MYNPNNSYSDFMSVKSRYDQTCAESKCEAQYREFIARHQLKDVYDRLETLCDYIGVKIERSGSYTVTKVK